VEGSCEHGIEPPGSIKCLEVLEWLHNWRLLKKGSAPLVSKEVGLSVVSFVLYIISCCGSANSRRHEVACGVTFVFRD
jgi:hypothetical protein